MKDCVPTTCTLYQEDKLNIGAGAGLCFVPDNGFDKTVPNCADIIRQGKCRYGFKSPYRKGEKA